MQRLIQERWEAEQRRDKARADYLAEAIASAVAKKFSGV